MGAAWERHGNGMLCVNRPLRCYTKAPKEPQLHRKRNFKPQSFCQFRNVYVFARSSAGAATKGVASVLNQDTYSDCDSSVPTGPPRSMKKEPWTLKKRRRNVRPEQYDTLHQATPRLGPYPDVCTYEQCTHYTSRCSY
jgi:hypothetical protein